MMLDIFSGFDDHNKVLFNFFYLVWVFCMFVVIILLQKFWVSVSGKFSLIGVLFFMIKELYSRTESKHIGGSAGLFSGLFMILVMFNILGLTPYVFSLTSHFAINVSLALPIWISIVLMSIAYDMPQFLAHLQPMGSPVMLNPFLCVIELVSLLFRPVTLALRLTANLSTGHILMGLLGVAFSGSTVVVSFFIVILGLFYFVFEMAVCFIQSYIFTLLPTLYSDEHPL